MFASSEAAQPDSRTQAHIRASHPPHPILVSDRPKGLTGFSRVARKPLQAVTYEPSGKSMNTRDFKLNRATTYATLTRKSLRAVTYENRGGYQRYLPGYPMQGRLGPPHTIESPASNSPNPCYTPWPVASAAGKSRPVPHGTGPSSL
jgi:hypothetical protein